MFEFIGKVLAAWIVADFVAGFFHWFEDRYLDENTPLLGKLVGGPNAMHHVHPMAMLKGNYWQRNYTTIVPSLTLGVASYFAGAPDWFVLALVFVSQANEVHAWAHWAGKVSWPIKMMQETGILQSPKHHAEHHRSPHLIRYCVMSEWLNPVLDRAKFWHGAEFAFARIGLRPLEVA